MFRNLNTKSKYHKRKLQHSTDQIRIIRSNIEINKKSQCKSLIITSPNLEEQKSLISAKLAISFAEKHQKVLLVDANFRKPSLHHWFQMQNLNGLSTILSQEARMNSYIQYTSIPRLFLLTAGLHRVNLSHPRVVRNLETLIQGWREEFDTILFEAPSYLKHFDAQMLANHLDGIILVIKENKTKKEEVFQTKKNLERVDKEILGVIYQTG